MADHDVVLTYLENGDFSAVPKTIAVRKGQTIAFKLGTGSMDGTIRITFNDRKFFSAKTPHFDTTGVFQVADGEVQVAKPLTGRTTYHCELLDAAGNVLAESKEDRGGDVVPSTRGEEDPPEG